MPSSYAWKVVPSPVGELRLVASDEALVGVCFPSQPHALEPGAREVARHAVLDLAASELDEYFRGTRRAFCTPLTAKGTPFQRKTWDALCEIPFGARWSYAELARRVGSPRAVRAVGAANGRNPLAIFVPCHRVVGSSGKLTGYAGGLAIKQWLLEHEGRVHGRGTGRAAAGAK